MQVKIGNGRLMAMRKMGWIECDCILIDWEEKRGLEVIDNRLSELSSWQDKELNKWFKNKGSDWWGIDDEIASHVEKIIKKEEKNKNKKQKTK
jgi:succinate dehydrogenase flavin-adding protein (antitoxin of CptAB toxin-antitoxin module)